VNDLSTTATDVHYAEEPMTAAKQARSEMVRSGAAVGSARWREQGFDEAPQAGGTKRSTVMDADH
jgi:hypothetical protein